jgi:DNA primase
VVHGIGGGACLTGRFEGRVVVPHIVRGKWAGFSSRATGSQEPKYLYPRGMDRRNALWGADWVPADAERVYVVEGVFDALPLFPYAVATFGKSVTKEQIQMIADLPHPVTICLDGDAWQECFALCARVAVRRALKPERMRVSWCRLPPGEDPGTLGWRVKEFLLGNG